MDKKQTQYPPLPHEGFIRKPHFLYLLGGMPSSTFEDGVRKGIFPKPVHLTDRTVGWRVEDVRTTLERIATETTR